MTAAGDYTIDTIRHPSGKMIYWGNEGGAEIIYTQPERYGPKIIHYMGTHDQVAARWAQLKQRLGTEVAEEASPMIKPPTNRFDTKREAFEYQRQHGGRVFRRRYTDPNTGMVSTTYVVKPEESAVQQDVQEGLSWKSLDAGLSLDNKIAIFEEYYTKGNLFESIDEDKKSYFVSLFDMSSVPEKNKRYIVVPLSLMGNRILPLDKPSYLEYLGKSNGQLVFRSNRGEIRYPSKTMRDLSVFNTFTFSSSDTYDKFRTALTLKFDTNLPDVILSKKGLAEDVDVDAIHAQALREHLLTNPELYENRQDVIEMREFLKLHATPRPRVGKEYVYASVQVTPLANFVHVAHFDNKHLLVKLGQDRAYFEIDKNIKRFPVSGSLSGDVLSEIYFFNSSKEFQDFNALLSLKYSDYKITYKILDQQAVREDTESSIKKKIETKRNSLSLARERRRARGHHQQGKQEMKLQAEIDRLSNELTQLKKQGVAEGSGKNVVKSIKVGNFRHDLVDTGMGWQVRIYNGDELYDTGLSKNSEQKGLAALEDAVAYTEKLIRTKRQGVAEGNYEETEETAVINMFEKLVKQGRDPLDMIAHRFGWGSYELDQLARNLGFKNSAGWARGVEQGKGVNTEGVAETSDYFRRKEREEAVISGKKPARKRSPAQTSDYARRREQEKKQGLAEGLDPDTQRLEQKVRDALESGDDYTARQYARMASTPEAKKYLQKIIRQEMYGKDTEQGVAEGNDQQIKVGSKVYHDLYGSGQVTKMSTGAGSDHWAEVKFVNGTTRRVNRKRIKLEREQGVSEGSKVKTAKGYGDVVQGTDVKTVAKADLGKNKLNLPKGYGDVVQPEKLKTVAKAKGVREGSQEPANLNELSVMPPDEYRVEVEDGQAHLIDGEGTVRVSMPVGIWQQIAGRKGRADEYRVEVEDGQVHLLDGEGTVRVSMPTSVWRGLKEEKIKGVDGRACWPGHRYAGRVKKADGTYKDRCVPVSNESTATTDTKEIAMEDQYQSVESAIAHRIMRQRLDLLKQYGPEMVVKAIEEIAQGVGSVDEIGSSDVSGWVRQVADLLHHMDSTADPHDTDNPAPMEEGVQEGIGDTIKRGVKSIRRGMQGWDKNAVGPGGVKLGDPRGIVKRAKAMDTDTAKKIRSGLDDAPKHSPADLQKRVLDRKLKGVAEGLGDYVGRKLGISVTKGKPNPKNAPRWATSLGQTPEGAWHWLQKDGPVETPDSDSYFPLSGKTEFTGFVSEYKGKQGVAEGAPELLKAEMPLVRHIERELAQHGYEKGTEEYKKMFKHSMAMYRKFGNIDAIKQGVAEGAKQHNTNEGKQMKTTQQIAEYRTLAGWQAAARRSGAELVSEGTRAVRAGILVGRWDGNNGQLLEGVEDRLEAAREKAAAKGLIKGREEEKSPVRKVAGSAYGGSKAKEEPADDGDDDDTPPSGGKKTSASAEPRRRGRPPGSAKKAAPAAAEPKRRGRPPKARAAEPAAPKKRGRPRRVMEGYDGVEDRIVLDGQEVDLDSIQAEYLAGDEATIVAAAYMDGTSLSDRELDALERQYPTLAYEFASEQRVPELDRMTEQSVSENAVQERRLSSAEKSRKEKFVRGMKKAQGDFEERYGERGEEVMHATATKMAKKKVAESRAARPDYLDLDKDGDRAEPMKKAAADAKKDKTDESIDHIRQLAGLGNTHRSGADMMKPYPVQEAAKPDYLDLDGDGDRAEPMKKAAADAKKDKKEKVDENVNMSISADGEEDVSMMIRKLAGIPAVMVATSEPAPATGCGLADAMQGIAEEYDNSPDETVYDVNTQLKQGGDLNRAKSQHANMPKAGDNPLAMHESTADYISRINDLFGKMVLEARSDDAFAELDSEVSKLRSAGPSQTTPPTAMPPSAASTSTSLPTTKLDNTPVKLSTTKLDNTPVKLSTTKLDNMPGQTSNATVDTKPAPQSIIPTTVQPAISRPSMNKPATQPVAPSQTQTTAPAAAPTSQPTPNAGKYGNQVGDSIWNKDTKNWEKFDRVGYLLSQAK